MTGFNSRLATLLLVSLVLLQGVSAQTLRDDELHLIAFLNNVLPNFTTVFNLSVPACQWKGLSCIGLGLHQRIWRLSLGGLGLNGTILPNTLGALTSLEVLDLASNFLTGEIPSDIFDLSSLAYLGLSNNSLTGILSYSIGNLVQLQTFDLSANFLSGSLPPSLGNLRSLKYLDLSNNNFSGGIPVLSTCNFLHSLDLSSNQFSGDVPVSTFSFNDLTSLNLSRNLLTGQIPPQLGYLYSLRSLDLSENNLEGALPELYNMGQLRTLSVSSNRLNGSLPLSLTRIPYLRAILVANNRLTGPLPPLPWGLSSGKIRLLDCRNNSLNGSIPEGLLASANLSVVRLASNYFTGSIPDNVTPLLQEFDLQSNKFTGNIPLTFASLPSLQKLDLSSNQLNGSIPWSLFKHTSLQHLGLAHNPVDEGLLPDVNQMVNLVYLNMSSSNIGGPIPDSVGDLGSLVTLDLSHNHINGSIPMSLSRVTNLTSLDLSYNNLTGTIPPELVSLTYLSHLNFSYNNLSGEVPHLNQWSTFDNTSFKGNPLLCGQAVNILCILDLSPAPAPDLVPDVVGSAPPLFENPNENLKVSAIIGIALGVSIVFCAILTTLYLFLARRRKPLHKKLPAKEFSKYLSDPVTFEADPSTWAVQVSQPGSIPVIMFEKPLLNLSFADLLQATSNFHKDTQIGDGGYGPAYKGVLPGGFKIVVKVLFDGGTANEFEKAAQLEALGKIRHPNLVPLVGYCLVREERLLVYEFMENGDLHRCLHELPEGTQNPEDWSKDTWEFPEGKTLGNSQLSWPVRHQIVLGVARALAFLHHGCSPYLVHRDVSSSNILLDSLYEPHLSDCGLAGLVDSGKRSETPAIGGLLGYVPPEYGQMWKATTRGDVYSFGVVLLELVTGKRPTGHHFHDSYGGNLVGWVRSLIRDKRGYKCLDPQLLSTGVESEMLETLRIGYLCTAELPSKRPTMQQIVGLLKDIQLDKSYL